MIETTVLTYLKNKLNVPVYMENPVNNTAASFVIIEKTGSNKTNYINGSTIALQSYAGSLYEAAQLNETVKAAMDNIDAATPICAATLDSDYNFTDQRKKKYRYQAIYNLVHY